MEFKDYYKIMGVEKDATMDEIKRAYRKLARRYHPDVSKEPNAEQNFKEVGEAYAVLKDTEKRTAYDHLGTDWKAGQDFRPPPNWDAGYEFRGTGFHPGDTTAHSDFFESLFGMTGQSDFGGAQATGRNVHGRGEDHHAKVTIDLEDAFRGTTRTITLRAPEVDADGHVVTRERSLRVAIPKGIKQGQHIRLAGQGSPGLVGGKRGDFFLEVAFKPHPFYRIEGRDVYLKLPVAPWEAALGATIQAPTPVGTIELKIPAASASGRKLRIKGRGIPGNPPGDLYAVLRVALPPGDTQQAQEIYRNMEQELAFNPRAGLGV
jgi:curved DNA-binding protein